MNRDTNVQGPDDTAGVPRAIRACKADEILHCGCMRTAVFALIVILGTLGAATVPAAGIRAQDLNAAVADRVQAVMPKVVAWRRDIHEHPELSNREVRTAGVVAAHLKALGLDVQTGVARTGVVGVLKGGRPGRV